jgi:hypothetical protein
MFSLHFKCPRNGVFGSCELVYIVCNAIPGSHDSTRLSCLVSVLYINAGLPTGKCILQHCIGLNIPEPLGLLLAGESVEDLDWI